MRPIFETFESRLLLFGTLTPTPAVDQTTYGYIENRDGEGNVLAPTPFSGEIRFQVAANSSLVRYDAGEDFLSASSVSIFRDPDTSFTFITSITENTADLQLNAGQYVIIFDPDTSEPSSPYSETVNVTMSAVQITPPEIQVTGVSDNSTTIAGVTDFGTVNAGSAAVQRTYAVKNVGTSALTLGAISVPAGFSVLAGLPASLAGGASASFILAMSTSSIGTKQGQVSFATNDSDENPFNFSIRGNVVGVAAAPVFVELQGNALVVTGTDGRDVIGVDIKKGFVRAGMKGGELLSFPAASVASIVVSAGAASDKITIETTLTLPATLNGGTGKDVLLGGSGNDYLSGQGSNDKLVGRLGADTLDGGDGVDLVEYTDRVVNSQPVNASLDGVANDGGVGEDDFILSNVENLLGGRGNDTLTGNDGPNILAGSRGADQLFGLGGNDTLFAFGESNAVDGLADILNGGADADTAVSDGLDTLLNIP